MSEQTDYWDLIEKYCFEVLRNDAGEDYNVSIYHGTVSQDIYKYASSIVESGYDAVMIRCDSDQFSDREVSSRFSTTETRIEILVAYNKEKSKGYLDQPRNVSYLLNRVWNALRRNPMYIHPEGKCPFSRSNKRKAFDDKKMQIISLQLKIKYMS